jgi:hypothetical protein
MSKYQLLHNWLRTQQGNEIYCTFKQIEGVLSFRLPESARTYPQWWENDPDHSQAKAWLEAGFHTEQVNLTAEILYFVRS